MEMIIGGAYQGKTEYARKQYPQLRWSDGGSVTEEELMNAQGVTGFQQYIRSELENGKDVSDLAEKIICKNPDIVLVSQEVRVRGCTCGCFLTENTESCRACMYEAGSIQP